MKQLVNLFLRPSPLPPTLMMHLLVPHFQHDFIETSSWACDDLGEQT